MTDKHKPVKFDEKLVHRHGIARFGDRFPETIPPILAACRTGVLSQAFWQMVTGLAETPDRSILLRCPSVTVRAACPPSVSCRALPRHSEAATEGEPDDPGL